MKENVMSNSIENYEEPKELRISPDAIDVKVLRAWLKFQRDQYNNPGEHAAFCFIDDLLQQLNNYIARGVFEVDPPEEEEDTSFNWRNQK